MKRVLAVGAEAHRPAEEELRNAGTGGAEGGAAFALQKNRRGPCNRLKISQFQVHGRESPLGARALVEPAKICFRAEAAAGNDGIVSVGQPVAQMRLPDAAFHGRNFRRPQPQLGIQRANLVANAQFAEASEAVSQVAADIDAINSLIRQRNALSVNLTRAVAE